MTAKARDSYNNSLRGYCIPLPCYDAPFSTFLPSPFSLQHAIKQKGPLHTTWPAASLSFTICITNPILRILENMVHIYR
jgi:hypothetical protein